MCTKLLDQDKVHSGNVVFPTDAFPLTYDENAVTLRLLDAIGIHFTVEDEILQSSLKNGLPGGKQLTSAARARKPARASQF